MYKCMQGCGGACVCVWGAVTEASAHVGHMHRQSERRGASDITAHHSSHHGLLRENSTLSKVMLQGLGAKLCCNSNYLLDYLKYS